MQQQIVQVRRHPPAHQLPKDPHPSLGGAPAVKHSLKWYNFWGEPPILYNPASIILVVVEE